MPCCRETVAAEVIRVTDLARSPAGLVPAGAVPAGAVPAGLVPVFAVPGSVSEEAR